MDIPDDPFSLVQIQDSLLQTAVPSELYSLDPWVLGIQVLILFLGLAFSAVFSGSEVALFSLSNRMEDLKQDQSSGSTDDRIIKMLDKPRRLLATILIGNTFANIVASVLAAVITGDIVEAFGLSEVIVFTAEVIILTFMILILSEITPKIIAINNPLKVSRRNSAFIYSLFILMKPFAKLIADSTISLERYLPKPTSKMTQEDIRTMAEVGEQEGSIKEDEREIIENVIGFGDIAVREIMTSRVNIIAISLDDALPEVLKKIRENGLSRMPLFENDLDNIVGVLYAKDVLPYLNEEIEEPSFNWKTVSRKALFIPATKKLDDLLRDFQQEKTHIAIVVDEYGGTEGIVTMDDILEEIVGDITDDSGEEETLFTRFKSGIYIFDAKIDLDDMEEILETTITAEDDDFETLGGLIYHLTESLPMVGERIMYKNLELTVHSVKNNRIRKVRVKVERPKEVESPTE
ncbi:MAG: CNNM domain-containing protein [Gracilimonas sp.]|nr:CNNM domain-containing protein [Gracilimonas sp.]